MSNGLFRLTSCVGLQVPTLSRNGSFFESDGMVWIITMLTMSDRSHFFNLRSFLKEELDLKTLMHVMKRTIAGQYEMLSKRTRFCPLVYAF